MTSLFNFIIIIIIIARVHSQLARIAPAFCSLVWWSEHELVDVTREVGHLLAFANSGERKEAHSRGPSNLKTNELGLSLGKHGQHGA